jgi:hypothetical protein
MSVKFGDVVQQKGNPGCTPGTVISTPDEKGVVKVIVPLWGITTEKDTRLEVIEPKMTREDEAREKWALRLIGKDVQLSIDGDLK